MSLTLCQGQVILENTVLKGHGCPEACPDLGASEVLPTLCSQAPYGDAQCSASIPCGLTSRLSVSRQNRTTSSRGSRAVLHSLCALKMPSGVLARDQDNR